jgi:hypothetical protein
MVNRSYLGYYDLKYTLGVVIIQASRGSTVFNGQQTICLLDLDALWGD